MAVLTNYFFLIRLSSIIIDVITFEKNKVAQGI